MRLSIAALAAAVLAGCSEGSFSEQEKGVKAELERHFAELNAEAGARAQAAKATKYDGELAATSLVLNRYDWNIGGAVYQNLVCPNASCGAKIGTLFSAGTDVRCPACNTVLADLKESGKAKPMFEIRSANTTPIVVIVRYVRHAFALDPNSTVAVSSKTEATNSIKLYTDTNERGRGAYYAGGLYRETASALCTTGFVFKGGTLREIDPASVKKMTQDPPETVSVSSMKLGRWGGIEEPLVGWLGKPPVGSAAKEAPKSP